MTKALIKLVLALCLVLEPAVLFAADTGVETKGNTQNGASIKDGSDKAANANKGAQAQQMIAGAMMFAMSAAAAASQNYGTAAMLAGLGILSMLQAGQHGKTAGQAGLTSLQSNGYDDGFDRTGTDVTNNPVVANDPSVKALGANIKALQDKGIVDAKLGKITTPDGKTFKPSDFSSQSAMAAAGFPSGAIAGAVDTYNAIQKRAADKVEKMKLGALTAAGGFDEGGGGGAAGGGSAVGDEGAGVAVAGGGGSGVSLERDPSSVAGMQKNYNGEPIGVAADSIFLMMTRRYKVKESQESFFSDAELALQK